MLDRGDRHNAAPVAGLAPPKTWIPSPSAWSKSVMTSEPEGALGVAKRRQEVGSAGWAISVMPASAPAVRGGSCP